MESQSGNAAPFILVQKPQELIRLFEGLIDQKIREILSVHAPAHHAYPNEDSPFLSARDVQQIFSISRQTVNDWRKSGLLQSFKIKSRRFFFKEQVEQLRRQMHEVPTPPAAADQTA